MGSDKVVNLSLLFEVFQIIIFLFSVSARLRKIVLVPQCISHMYVSNCWGSQSQNKESEMQGQISGHNMI